MCVAAVGCLAVLTAGRHAQGEVLAFWNFGDGPDSGDYSEAVKVNNTAGTPQIFIQKAEKDDRFFLHFRRAPKKKAFFGFPGAAREFAGAKKNPFRQKGRARAAFFFCISKAPFLHRFVVDFGSTFGRPDPHDSMVFTMYYALSHFLGKASKMVPKKVPKWTPESIRGVPEAPHSGKRPILQTTPRRGWAGEMLPRGFLAFCFFLAFLGSQNDPIS